MGINLSLLKGQSLLKSMTKNKYLEIQQEIQQQFPQHPPQDQQPPQVQQEQNQHDQTLPQQFNWQELNQQFQEMRVDQGNFYQNFQEQQRQFFEDFGNQQKLYKQEFQYLRVQQHQYHQELQNQQTLTNKAVQELKKSQDKHHKEFLAHKKELQRQYQKDCEEYVTITNHEIDQDIPAFFLSNMEKGKGKFEGALRPIPVGGSSSKGKGVEDVDHGKRKTWEARDEGDSDEE
ncbi:hypothetical protein PIB30_062906 [Stylosanthes scabra]|uniref:Uncharacterized protein n=1 Tax=Stylosanthes scabra TaxID=79078 RepID=A0ABU6RLD1_9FABA|nr:hypothetical protein [Stylosanthes scabra]